MHICIRKAKLLHMQTTDMSEQTSSNLLLKDLLNSKLKDTQWGEMGSDTAKKEAGLIHVLINISLKLLHA